MVSITTFEPGFEQKQVDLIWKVTDSWKYAYQTSYQTVENAYSREGFDPQSRFYAVDNEELVGFTGADISEDQDGNTVARMRLPLAIDGNKEIIQELMKHQEHYLKSRGVTRISAPAGVGLGNTIKVAEYLGFQRKNETFRRSYASISEMTYSGDTTGIDTFTSDDTEVVEGIFMHKMGMPEQQGKGFFGWVVSNYKRKNANQPHTASMQIYREDDEIKGFSYLLRSDHLPHIAHSMPFYFSGDLDQGREIIDHLISAHLKEIKDIELFGNYLLPNLYYQEELYNSFGFEFDPSYIYEKHL